MSNNHYERSEAFISDYHALCEKHRVRIEQRTTDCLVAVILSPPYRAAAAPYIYSAREYSEVRAAAYRGKLCRAVRAALSSSWWTRKDLFERSFTALACGLDREWYNPETDRAMLEEVVAELREEHPQLFGSKSKR